MDKEIIYSIGFRDAIAYVLATASDEKIKLRKIAEFYEKSFKEKHFSHQWHTS